MPTKQATRSEVLAVLGSPRAGKYQCPACDQWHLIVNDKAAGKVLVDCKTPNCPKGAAWKAITDKLGNGTTSTDAPGRAKKNGAEPWPGLTLSAFAKQKGFHSAEALEMWWGIYEADYPGKRPEHKGKRVVAFPYGMEIGGKWTRTGTKIRGGNSHQTEWLKGENDKYIAAPYGLCRPGLENCADIVLCEGESDVLTLDLYNIPALGISGAENWKTEFAQLAPIRNAERIFIIQEPDAGGKEFVTKVSKDLPAEKVYIVPFPADTPDPNALHLKCLKIPKAPAPRPWHIPEDTKDIDEAREVIKHRKALLESGEWNPRADIPFLREFDGLIENAKPLAGKYKLRSMADVQMKSVEWLWPGRVPLGKLTIFGGAPGCAKSMVACSIASIVTKGKPFPDADNKNKPFDVLMLYSEDEAEDTVAPRLEAAGADRRRVFDVKISVTKDAGDEERQIAFDRDRTLLEKMLKENPSIRLVIVDPITSFIGDININKEQEVRDVLVPLKELAAKTGVTFIMIAHFNKRSDVTALNKILGAVAMTGVCRAVWLFAEDESEEGKELKRYLMLYGKVNIARKADGLEYTISEKQIIPAPADPTPYVEWGEKTEVSANQVMGLFGPMSSEKATAPKTEKAKEWLRGVLSQGQKPADEITAAAEKDGIKERTLNTAKKDLGIKSERKGGVWYWGLSRE